MKTDKEKLQQLVWSCESLISEWENEASIFTHSSGPVYAMAAHQLLEALDELADDYGEENAEEK